jgi:O-antigen ligase
MSIRLTVLYIFVIGLSIYAWKDWFKSLCVLILMMAIMQRDDMPKSIFGIQGMNQWNMLFIMVFIAWATARRREGLRWDMPPLVTSLLLMYGGVVLIGVLRAAFDRGYFNHYPLRSLISEELINSVKWVLPGLLLFDGCRTRSRLIMALGCLLAMYFLIAVQVVSRMPLQAAISENVIYQNNKNLTYAPGYCATDVSVMLAGASWGMLAGMPLVFGKWRKIMVLGAAGAITFGQALTGGRGGYMAWGCVGLLLCLLKWRKYLIIAPVVAILLPVLLPGTAGRMLEGFGHVDVAGEVTTDTYAATSGRVFAWPYVIDEIRKSPWIGYGRLAMPRTGLSQRIGFELQDNTWPHPHNMYLETLLDNGILGSMPILGFWAAVVACSARLFRSDNRLYSAVGGLSLALTLTSLLGGATGQHFYPQEQTFGIWMAFFLSLRVHIEEQRVQAYGLNAEDSWGSQAFEDAAGGSGVWLRTHSAMS